MLEKLRKDFSGKGFDLNRRTNKLLKEDFELLYDIKFADAKYYHRNEFDGIDYTFHDSDSIIVVEIDDDGYVHDVFF
jgi:hypothetical protein